MPKNKALTDDEHVLSAFGAAKAEGAKALLIELGLNTISTIRIFLDDEYRRFLSDDETAIRCEFDPQSGRLKRLDSPH